MTDLDSLARYVAEWHYANYPDADVRDVALKVAEEAGEVCRAVVEHAHPSLHRDTGPRLADELGDVIIACAALAERANIDLDGAVQRRWQTISRRSRPRVRP